ncbi:MAG: glutamate-1-semialdehyde 2,1-aminomutase [Chthoniobacterales bacterium]|nr:glutamate-1-semialdehyde 2,1-aminomutase [Chthoniobacterales bacterium]
MSRSSDLFTAAKRRIPGGVNSPVRAFRGLDREPFFVEHAAGAKIRDVDGIEYIDYVGTWGPAILGHAPRVVVEAVASTAQHGVSFGIPNPLEVEMAELICSWVPLIEKVRMVNSGTEATMSAIRLARGFTGRDKIIKFEGCYHGHADSLLVNAGSAALTHGRPDSAGVPVAFASLTISLPFNNIAAVRAAFAQNKGEIAAIILEPIPANAGLYLPRENFLQQLRDECTAAGALLIFDEVMTGFRVARGGAQELYGITPDLTALGKVIGGGLPVGAFGGRAEIMDQLSPDGPVYQAGTLSGNPLAMAAGLAQLRELERVDGWKVLEQLGAAFEERVRAAMRASSLPLTFHRIGSMFCLFFTAGPVSDLASAKTSNRDTFARYFRHCLDHGVYFAPSQFETGFVSVAHSAADIERTAEVAAASLTAAAQ